MLKIHLYNFRLTRKRPLLQLSSESKICLDNKFPPALNSQTYLNVPKKRSSYKILDLKNVKNKCARGWQKSVIVKGALFPFIGNFYSNETLWNNSVYTPLLALLYDLFASYWSWQTLLFAFSISFHSTKKRILNWRKSYALLTNSLFIQGKKASCTFWYRSKHFWYIFVVTDLSIYGA